MIFFLLPAYNEAESIAFTLRGIHEEMRKNSGVCNTPLLYRIIVCDNNSTDETEKIALKNDAIVVNEKISGYGHTLMKGVSHIQEFFFDIPDEQKILIFMDADGQDAPEKISKHLKNLEKVDFSIASRTLGNVGKNGDDKRRILRKNRENSDATSKLHTVVNRFFGVLLRMRTGKIFSDLGPFRALTLKTFLELEMQELTFGWTAEMQKKIALRNISYTEFYSPPKKRFGGTSKVSGSAIWKQIKIGLHIVWVIVK